MKTLISLVLLSVLLTGCSLFPDRNKGTLADIETLKIRLLPNDEAEVTHEEVINYYQRYLEVSTDPELQVRVAHRVAAIKLQAEEQALDQELEQKPVFDAGDTELSRKQAITAIRDYETLLQDHPDRSDNDAILYQLAKAYTLAGKPRLAIVTLEKLVTDFPKSEYYLEGEFRLGQLFYAAGDYEMAVAAYQRLLDQGRSGNTYYVSAGYLQGWSLFKMQDYENSLLAFSRVLDEEYPDVATLESASGGELDMRNDILRVMAIIFSTTGDWEGIATFYDRHGVRHYEYLVYDRLATLYYQREYHRSAASTLRAFVLRYPLDARASAYYERLIEGYSKARYPELNRSHKEQYVQLFGVGSAYWNHHTDDALRSSLTKSLSAYIWDLAGFYHGMGQSSKVATDKNHQLQEAKRWYEEYVRSFPQADDAVKAHFLLAEVSFELKDYVAARHHYEIVAYQYPDYEKSAEAGYAAILAYNAHTPSAETALAWRQATVASAMRFVQEYPSDPRSGTVLVNTAEMLLKDRYYPQALSTARLAAAIEQDLTPRYRYGAALVRGHASFELGYFAESEQALQLALAQQQADAATQKELRNKIAASIYEQGSQSKEQGNHADAVHHWRRLAVVIPESDTRILAEYDAATLLMEMKDYPQAVEVLLAFRQQYPQHRLNADIPSKLIIAYEQQENWQAAATELQGIWKSSTDTEQQRIACYQAAQYFDRAGDTNNALEMYRHYAHTYPQPFDASVEAHYQLDQIYARLNDEEKRRFWLDKVITLHNKAGDQQSDRSRYLAASAAFQLAEFERSGYEKLTISLPLDKSITRKNAALQAAQRRYTQAVQLGVLEFTTASTFHLGQLYAQMSKALMQSERPEGLDELELEEYQFLLEEQAFPLDEAAIEIHQTNAGRTRDGLYDNWVRQSFNALAELLPGQYNKPEKVLSYVDQIR